MGTKEEDNRTELMRQIRDEIVANKSLPLYRERVENGVFPVIGEGDHHAKLMFIGEAPGRNEAATGRPFCGAAGKILDELLVSAGFIRKDVYVTNIVKDRPPFNRDPLPEEIEAYGPYLDRQIAIIKPQVIVTLGRFSMNYILQKFGLGSELKPISVMHGKEFHGTAQFGPITIVPLYHPAVVVYNSTMKESIAKDFKILTKYHA